MLFRRKLDLRLLAPVTQEVPPPTLEHLRETAFYSDVLAYFGNYPERSLMSDHCRAALFSLIRARRPTYIAEIGTFRAGTTEVMARACWENNWGIIYTTDPFGRRRCPPIIKSWPKELRKYVSFHPLSSMDFFSYLDEREVSLDFTLVDGNHDFEYALFDLQMAARRTRPNGLIVMDNAEQSGPFHAARTFLEANPAWHELGRAVALHRPSNPFDLTRASLPDTSFILLQSPPYIPISAGPHSWGQMPIGHPAITGLAVDLVRPANGVLHYQVTLRAFFTSHDPIERKTIGAAHIRSPDPGKLSLPFIDALEAPERGRYTVEIDLSWEGPEPLALAALPTALSRL